MREFFKPWRRKIGVVMLVVACAGITAWIRSGIKTDKMSVCTDSSTKFGVMCLPNKIVLERHYVLDAMRDFSTVYWNTEPVRDDGWNDQYDRILQTNLKWRCEFLGFRYGERLQRWNNVQFEDQRVFVMPHWSVVLPLTLLSACLLLSVPRPKKSDATLPPESDHA